jgi:hypothetical protein
MVKKPYKKPLKIVKHERIHWDSTPGYSRPLNVSLDQNNIKKQLKGAHSFEKYEYLGPPEYLKMTR